MRSFPRTALRRTAAGILAATLALGTVSLPLTPATADDLKHRQQKVRKSIGHAEDDLEHSSARARKAATRLSEARAQLADARTELATARGKLAVAQDEDARMQAELDVAEAELVEAEAELVEGRAQMTAQAGVVASTISDIYTEGDPQLLAFSSVLESSSTADLTLQTEVRDLIVGRETREYDKLHATKVVLRVTERQVKQARNTVAEKRAEAAENLVVMEGLETEAEAARAAVQGLVGERTDARQEAVAAKAADLRTLKKLKADAARIKEMLRKRALAAMRAAAARNQRRGPTGGILQMPVAGGMTSPFGWRTHPIYGYWGLHDGADFGGGCAQPIHAATSGRVISSYWSDVYGNRLIIDHGAVSGVGLATIYNHAASYTVSPGTQVERGQVIGYVGDTGWSTACHLHFTVMANGSPVDPANWF